MIFAGLDIETKSKIPEHREYALQPWRIHEGTAEITHYGIRSTKLKFQSFGPVGDIVTAMDQVSAVTDDVVFVTYNGVFDIAFLYAYGVPVDRYRWADAMLLWKWLENSQDKELRPAWSLVDAVESLLIDEPWAQSFLNLKAEMEDQTDNPEYWRKRVIADAFATERIAEVVWSRLTSQQKKSAMIESSCLVPVAKSWVHGVRMDIEKSDSKKPEITREMEEIETRLVVKTVPTTGRWSPSKILRSPKQMGELLYDMWGLPVNDDLRTPKGDRSTSKSALTYLADIDDRVLEILRWRELNTQLTKFIESPVAAAEYVGSNTLHPQPKLFSTYTGRMTYGSKIQGRFKVGMALHQFPRPKELRKLVLPPEGYDLVEFDAAGQEMRFMGCLSGDAALVHVFNQPPPNDDAHSYTGSRLAGISFEKFLELKHAGNREVTGPHGLRYQGKFTNLSCQYRIGAKKFRIKSKVDYGMDISYLKAMDLQNAYHRAYPGIKRYWKTAVVRARALGYAETLAGRRYALTRWRGDMGYSTEQSAINFPIQGSGGDQKELAVAILTKKFPKLVYGFDLHDALFMYIKSDFEMKKEYVAAAKQCLDNLPYEAAWGWAPPVPLTWDAKMGPSWGELEEI